MIQSRPQLWSEPSSPADGQFEEEHGNGSRYVSVRHCMLCACASSKYRHGKHSVRCTVQQIFKAQMFSELVVLKNCIELNFSDQGFLIAVIIFDCCCSYSNNPAKKTENVMRSIHT